TRGQAIAALIKLEGANYSADKETGYKDVPASSWAVGAVATAIRDKIIPPGNGNNLDINKYITRSSLAILVTRTKSFQLVPKNGWPEEKTVEVVTKLTDVQPKDQTETMLKAIEDLKRLQAEKKELTSQKSELEKLKSAHLAAIADLEKENTALTENLSEHIKLYNNYVKKAEVQNEKGIKEREELFKRKQILLGEIKDYKADIATLNTKVTSRDSQIINLNNQIFSLKADIVSLNAKHKELTESLISKYEAQITSFNTYHTTLVASLNANHKELVESLVSKHEAKTASFNTYYTTLVASLNADIASLTDIKTTLNAQLAYANKEIDAASNIRKALFESKQTLSDENRRYKTEYPKIKSMALTLNAQRMVLKAELATTNAKLKQALKDIESGTTIRESLIERKQELIKENEEYKTRCANLTTHVATLNSGYIAKLETQLKNTTTQLSKTKVLLTTANIQLTNIRAKYAETIDNNTRLTTINTQQKNQIQELTTNVNNQAHDINSKNILIARLEEQVTAAVNIRKALFQSKQELSDNNRDAEKQLKELHIKYAALTSANLQLKAALSPQRDQRFIDIQQQYDKSIETLKKLAEENAALKGKAANSQTNQSNIAILEKELARVTSANTALLQRKQELLEENKTLKQTAAKPAEKQSQLDKQYQASLAKITALEAQLKDADQEKSELFTRKQELIAENENLKKTAAVPSKEESALNTKLTNLEKELAESKKSQQALFQRKQELVDENKQLKESLTKPIGQQTELQKQYKESLANITKLETDLNKANQEKEALFKRKQELIAENEKLKQSVSEPAAESLVAKKSEPAVPAEKTEETVTTAKTIVAAVSETKVSTPSEVTSPATEFTANSITVTFYPQPVLQEENLSITLKGIPAIVPVTRVEIIMINKAVELILQPDSSYKGQIAIPADLTGGNKKAVVRIFDNAAMLIEKEVQYEVMQWWKG
ncbi:MAG: S-layer homology domain-containing protein, partial [Candidatus Margulisiibacteriota bacterium]